MKIYLTGQNNFGNRGCEALVRSTAEIVRQMIPGAEFLVPSADIFHDSRQWPNAEAAGVYFVPVPQVPSRFIQWSRICSRLPVISRLYWPVLRQDSDLPPGLAEADAILSIGGDNYSLDYDLASLAYFVGVAELGLQRELPVLLWGASVGPFSRLPAVEERMVRHLRKLTAITAREQHSVNYLASIGVSTNVTAVVDSAFAMRPSHVDLSSFWPMPYAGSVVGLNLSPLVAAIRARAGKHTDFIDEAVGFVRHCVRERGMAVLLVPHVAPLDGSEHNNDEVLLARVMARCGDLGRKIGIVPSGMNAEQLKYIISQCRYFVGARTHATIAALSMGLPTISIAYSVKALGINNDLFGHQRYVLDTRELDTRTLCAGLNTLVLEEESARALLSQKIPLWQEKARLGASLLAKACAAKTSMEIG